MDVDETGRISDWYMPRVVDAQLQTALRASPAVVLEGPRACGKTSTGGAQARSEVMFGSNPSARLAAQVDPVEILAGPEPRLLDEWQLAPEIWNQVRAAGDEGRKPGRFILTGSASPTDDITRHTGTGRITRVRMRPMSLFETGLSSGAVPLNDLFSAGTGLVAAPTSGLRDLVEAVCRGGWPASSTSTWRRRRTTPRRILPKSAEPTSRNLTDRLAIPSGSRDYCGRWPGTWRPRRRRGHSRRTPEASDRWIGAPSVPI